ncbi:MAG: cob(I)yrinic acid a,c-diamide adenosyltransferase [Anaerolineales bacterium]|jgi:cob(I)alamin adenosyltransferase
MSKYYSGEGDDGYTGLLGEGRVPKYAARPEAFGTLDEAQAALGLARSLAEEASGAILREVQVDLYHIMAETAAPLEHADRFRTLDSGRVAWLEEQLEIFGRQMSMPSGFVISGDTQAGAAFDVARTVVRRAERQVAALVHEGEIENSHILPYLNRLSSLCFVLSLWENQQAGVDGHDVAKGGPR